MIRYTLSSRQRKELYVRGRELEIAIPAPPGDLADALDFARRSLDSIDADDVHAAEECEILVAPSLRGAPPVTVTDLFGRIVRDGSREPGTVTLCVAVVIATLRAGKIRHACTGPEWPVGILIDGRPLLGRPETEDANV